MKLLQRGLVSGAVVWATALPLATFATAQPRPASATSLLALAVYAIGGAVCHQIEARSFHLWNQQMPVCARCTGIYAGAALAAVAAYWWRRRPEAQDPRPIHPRWILGAALIPAAATLVFEWTTGIVPANATRAASGLVLGAAVAWTIVRAVGEPPPHRTAGR